MYQRVLIVRLNMNSSAFILLTLFSVQLCGQCLAGVMRDPLESRELSKDSPEHLEETWDRAALEGKNPSSEEESSDKLDSEETEEEKDVLRPIRSPQVFSENSSDGNSDETSEDVEEKHLPKEDDLNAPLSQENPRRTNPSDESQSDESNEDLNIRK
uniref:Uncharacterized protein n=1 Tax=Riptortus pedestris TaxID=329032 RepID=R4WIZ0_RIPPE|nr:unknown secreted protein [Riptortus pedestris]